MLSCSLPCLQFNESDDAVVSGKVWMLVDRLFSLLLQNSKEIYDVYNASGGWYVLALALD